MTRPILTLLLLLANTWAITAVLGSRRPVLARTAWALGIAALPILGFGAWLATGPRARTAGRHP